MKYLLDSNIFVTAKNLYYAFDLCPGFWDWLKTCYDLCSVSEVYAELAQGTDDLALWIKQFSKARPDFFIALDASVQNEYANIANALYSQKKYTASAIKEYLGVADSWLVATAVNLNATIVTHEKSEPNRTRKVKIPDVAALYGIQCVSIFDVMRFSGVRLCLA